MITVSKVCGHCKIEKLAEFFPLRKKNGGKYVWLRLQCFECVNEIRRMQYIERAAIIIKRNSEYTERNKEAVAKRNKIYREINKEKIKKNKNDKYKNNAEKIKKRRKEYYNENPQRHIDIVSKYAKNNRIKINKRVNDLHHIKKEYDINYKMKRVLRGRVLKAIKNKGIKCAKTMELTGCTIEFLIQHIETLFTDGMNWGNHGIRGWHIDHKKPCSSFDLTDAEQQKICFNWTNLQPLWWLDNIKKSNKIHEDYGNA